MADKGLKPGSEEFRFIRAGRVPFSNLFGFRGSAHYLEAFWSLSNIAKGVKLCMTVSAGSGKWSA